MSDNDGWGAELFWPEARWRALQAECFAAQRERASQYPLYSGMSLPTEFKSLPFTTKDQLARQKIEPPDAVAEWVCTSGTLGKALDVPLTPGDLERLAENEAVALSIAGIRRGDLVVLAVAMDRMFVAGLAYWLGLQKIGAACVRAGPRVAEHPEVLRDLVRRMRLPGQRVFVIGVPSFLVNAIPPEGGLAGIVAIGEPVKRADGAGYNTLGVRLHERFGCAVMSTYAMTETCTSFAEGPECFGGHLNPELAVVEVLNSADEDAAEGEIGEVVVTPLGVEGLPLLRFRTGDMAALYRAPCRCGRTTPRVGPIVGRKHQLLKVRGVSVYPETIVEAVRSCGQNGQNLDCVVIAEEIDAGGLSDRVTICVAGADSLRQELESQLRAILRVVPDVRWVAMDELTTLQLSAGRKVTRFLDRRS